MFLPTLLFSLAIPLSILSSPLPSHPHSHHHTSPHTHLFARSTHLFARSTPLPPVGSDAWTALYPADDGTPATPSTVPQSWLDALADALGKGLIPDVGVSALDASSGLTSYPDGADPTGEDICSFTYQCNATDDIVSPPAGVLALSFDDGPLAGPSDTLYSFLSNHSQHATHFMIGLNILQNPAQFLRAFQQNQDHIAVHTWSHPYLTTKTNAEVVAELGWTMQIIADSTGGLLPSAYRPPYGDTDNRVRAIAREVFGLRTVTWNQDSEDWMIGEGTTLEVVEGSLRNWVVGGGGVQGEGLLVLEHELMDETVQAFMDTYPSMLAANWTIKPVPDAFGFPWYVNALNSSSPPTFSLGVASPVPTPAPDASSTIESSGILAGSITGAANAARPANSMSNTSGAEKMCHGPGYAMGMVGLCLWGAVMVGGF